MDQQSRTRAEEHEPALPPPTIGKKLPRRAQFALLGFAVALIIAGAIAGPAALHLLGLSEPASKAEEEAATPAPGEPFKVTDRQWAALKILPVAERTFQDAAET